MTNQDVAFGSDTLRASASESTVDIANNRSLVVVSLILIGGGTWYNFHDGSAAVRVNGGVIGSASGTACDMPSPGTSTITIINSASVWVNHDANGQATVSFSGHLTWPQFPKDVDTGNGSLTLSNIVQAPTAPGAPTGTRVNDGQINLSWTNNSSLHHEYASQSVQRSVDGGAYVTIASGLAANATSYSDTTTSANHKYAYKITATNAKASATSSASASVFTTPAADSNMTATKVAGGDVQVTWTVNSNYTGNSELQHDVYDSPDGTTWTYLASVFGATATYTHTAPATGVTHRYRTVSFPPGTTLYATSGTSNIVTLLSTANPPTGLSPSGVSRDATGAIVFTWTHNPTDGTAQTSYQLQYQVDGGAFTTVGPTSSSVSSYTLPAATLTNGHTITWHVATAGQNGTLSAYSANASFTTSAKPTVTINTPTSTYTLSTLTIAWGYFQAQSSAQASWEARLYDAGNVLLDSITGTTETTGTFNVPVTDGASYTVKMTVTSAAGLQSTEASQPFTVHYLLPAAIAVAGVFDNAAGFTVLTLTGQASTPGYSALVLDANNADYASTPDAAALDITGDIDIRIDLQPTTWTPAADAVLVAKWDSGNQRSYECVLTTAGLIKFRLSTDGTAGTIVEASSSVAPAPVNGRLSLRIARVGSTVTFYTSTDTNLTTATWTQLGTTATAAGVMFASTALLRVGADGTGSLAALAGNVYSVELRNSASTVVANPAFSTKAAGTTSFADAAGLTWTVAGAAAINTIVAATEPIVSVDVQRQINGGAWVTVLTGVVLDVVTHLATVQDTVPITVGTNTYRAIAYSSLPSSVMSPTVNVVTNETTWGYLSGEGKFATVARFAAMPTYTPSTSRAKALYHFAGRPKPVQLSGEALTYTLSVVGKLSAGSGSAADFEALGQAQGIHCWRGPDGRRVFGSLAKVDTGVTRVNALTTIAFTITELDFTEGDQ